ncbi:MAG: V-type ATP synthase subunit E [Oscillospiraceae bacterium]
MDTNNEKLQKFIDAVNDEIDIKVNEMLAEAENEKKAILAEAERESEETAEKHFNISSKKSGNRYARDISKAELDMKKSVIQHREELTSNIFEAVEKKLKEYKNDPKYVDMLIKNLLMTHISDGAEIFLAPDDMKYAETMKKAIPSCDVKFIPDEKILLGGISVYDPQKGTISDKTFDLAVEEQKRAFANSNAFAE